MVVPESLPPPGAEDFAEGSNLLVRAPLAALPTELRPAADSRGTVTLAEGGLGPVVEFETDLFVGRMMVRRGAAGRGRAAFRRPGRSCG